MLNYQGRINTMMKSGQIEGSTLMNEIMENLDQMKRDPRGNKDFDGNERTYGEVMEEEDAKDDRVYFNNERQRVFNYCKQWVKENPYKYNARGERYNNYYDDAFKTMCIHDKRIYLASKHNGNEYKINQLDESYEPKYINTMDLLDEFIPKIEKALEFKYWALRFYELYLSGLLSPENSKDRPLNTLENPKDKFDFNYIQNMALAFPEVDKKLSEKEISLRKVSKSRYYAGYTKAIIDYVKYFSVKALPGEIQEIKQKFEEIATETDFDGITTVGQLEELAKELTTRKKATRSGSITDFI